MVSWLLGVLGALVLAVGIQTYRLDSLQGKAATFERTIEQHEKAAGINQAALNQCLDTNAENEADALRFGQAAEAAAERVSQYARRLYEAESQIANQVESFNDEQCRTLDDPLPGDFVEWLRDT